MTLEPPGRVPAELDRALRLALAAVLQAQQALGLTPLLRARSGVVPPRDADDGFVLLEPAGSA